eukprot:Nitzschia sp. Nitz4//scaffold242_size29646//5712//8904//NITZ4_008047-RA/size29646-processed-gene-0.10-mRNA-1//1//CDS//3329543803//2197//frame0
MTGMSKGTIWEACFFWLIALQALVNVNASTTASYKNYSYEDLLPCTLSTVELTDISQTYDLEPCVIFHIDPSTDPSTNELPSNATRSIIPLVQVTPSGCGEWRDGPIVGLSKLNEANDGLGVPVGYHQEHFVQFSLVSLVAGNPDAISEEEYSRRHDQLLRSVLESTRAPYIIGTCTWAAAYEKEAALEHEAILMSQVGPPGYYEVDSNPFVFGIHINSDIYPKPTEQSLLFLADTEEVGGPQNIPIRVVYRSKAEFFYSTCQSVVDRLREEGFTDMKAILYDHAGDEDGDGIINQYDIDFLESLADEACPQESSQSDEGFYPAIFLCTLTEQDVILNRLIETGCRPISLWTTPSSWAWAQENIARVPYFQGGGQWHRQMDYSDDYCDTGTEVLAGVGSLFGYYGSYDVVVSYSIPVLFSQHLQSAYRVQDNPDPVLDFSTSEGRENLRRAMLVMNVDTIFGPVSFNDNQRNNGRGAAATQWLPIEDDGSYSNALVSPFLQAEASIVLPAESAQTCNAGEFDNNTIRMQSRSIMTSGCSSCPVDSFTQGETLATTCTLCPAGATTLDETGSSVCYVYEDNIVSLTLINIGHTAVTATWVLAGLILLWLFWFRNEPVVKVSQIEFLVLICVGTMVCSSSLIAFGIQRETGEDLSPATMGCKMAPFLYSVGWCLRYSSLTAKTFRLYQTMRSLKVDKRVAVPTALQMSPIVIVGVLLSAGLVALWVMKGDLEYERVETGREEDLEEGIVTIFTAGHCVTRNYNVWRYIGPLLAFHLAWVVGTHILLCNVRDIADRYQEQKFVALSSAIMFEILLIGAPVFFSVRGNANATYIVCMGLVALDDLCKYRRRHYGYIQQRKQRKLILCVSIAVLVLIFGPKMWYQWKGVEGPVEETILRDTAKRRGDSVSKRSDSHDGMSQRQLHALAALGDGSGGSGSAGGGGEESSESKFQHEFASRMQGRLINRVVWSGHTSSVVDIIPEQDEESQEMGETSVVPSLMPVIPNGTNSDTEPGSSSVASTLEHPEALTSSAGADKAVSSSP